MVSERVLKALLEEDGSMPRKKGPKKASATEDSKAKKTPRRPKRKEKAKAAG